MKKQLLFSKIIRNKFFCLFWLLFGFVYITWYGFFKNPLQFTASMIGLDFPWHFKMWGIFSAVSLLLNITYLYRKYGYTNKLGRVLMYVGCACIIVTINIPSTEIMSLQLVAHWSTALLFAALNGAAIGVFLIQKSKDDKKMCATLIVFVAMLALMVILLVIFGKNGIIESIPMWGAYLILFALNYTNIYSKKIPEKNEEKKETVTTKA